MDIKLKRLSSKAMLPTKGSESSAYLDLYSVEDRLMGPGHVLVVSTGWLVEVPRGYFLDVRARSGLASRGVWVHVGTVDPDFRGELKVILVNHSQEFREVRVGDRVAQCALIPVTHTTFSEVETLSETERGTKGYGSTGR